MKNETIYTVDTAEEKVIIVIENKRIVFDCIDADHAEKIACAILGAAIYIV